MKSVFSCKKKRASVERAAFTLANRIVADGPVVTAWEPAETREGASFLKPVVEPTFNQAVTVRSPLNPKPYKVSIEALGIVVTLYVQNLLERDNRFKEFSNGFQDLYRSALAHPEMEPILAAVS